MIPICHVNSHYDDISILTLLLICVILCVDRIIVYMYLLLLTPLSGGRVTRLCCIVLHKVVWCSMLSSSFFRFRAGSTPNDGRVLQSSTDLRLQVDGGPWWRWWWQRWSFLTYPPETSPNCQVRDVVSSRFSSTTPQEWLLASAHFLLVYARLLCRLQRGARADGRSLKHEKWSSSFNKLVVRTAPAWW